MLLRLPSILAKLILGSFLIWILLSTAVPQVLMRFTEPQIQHLKFTTPSYPYNSITSPTPLPIRNSTVYYVIGHPDDEVMFFSPSIVEMAKNKHGNKVRIVCFSRGDAVDESFGDIRTQELENSARIIGISSDDVIVLDTYKDGMDVDWSYQDISASLLEIIGHDHSEPLVLVTFDEKGVSGHPNHIALYHGTRHFFESNLRKQHKDYKLFVLKSLNFWEKYSFTVLTNVELLVDLVLKFILSNILKVKINISFFHSYSNSIPSIKFYSDLNMLSVSYAAMAYGHFSQMVWFRYGWLVFSRYLTFNHLIQIH